MMKPYCDVCSKEIITKEGSGTLQYFKKEFVLGEKGMTSDLNLKGIDFCPDCLRKAFKVLFPNEPEPKLELKSITYKKEGDDNTRTIKMP
jgi:hypothetical protein